MKTTSLANWTRQTAMLGLLLLGVLPPKSCPAAALPPVITGEPANQTTPVQGTATFHVVVNSLSTLSYQWRKNGADIAGATSSSHSITNAQLSDQGNYSVNVTNAGGWAISSNATLTVLLPPTITNQPQSQTVLKISAASFSVVAGGTAPLSYQWWFGGAPLAGATNSVLTISKVQNKSGGPYLAVVTNAGGSVTSSVANLTVVSPVELNRQPMSQTVTQAQNVSFSVSTDGSGPLSYQWSFNGTALPGATNSTLVLTNVQPAAGGNYSVLVWNPWSSATSAVATLTVISTTPPSLSAAAMATNGFTFQLSVPTGSTYVIFFSTNCLDWIPLSTNVAAAASVAFTDPEASNYRCRFYRAMLQ